MSYPPEGLSCIPRRPMAPPDAAGLHMESGHWRYEGLMLVRDYGGGHNFYARVGFFRWTNGVQLYELWKQVTNSKFSII